MYVWGQQTATEWKVRRSFSSVAASEEVMET
jgi:hypothetical protein